MKPPMVTLDNKVILVTGAGSGLGAALSRTLVAAGARVAMLDRHDEPLQRLRDEIDPEQTHTLPLTVDLLDAQAVCPVMERVQAHFGGLDVLINNAGTDVTAAMEALSLADWERVIATNLSAPFFLSKLALPLLRERQGQIVNIASTAALRAWPNATAYHASKWGLRGLSHAMHAELRAAGMRVMCVIVGGMQTPFLLERFEGLDLDRLQDPANVAHAIAFALTMPVASAVPEMMVMPQLESSWP